MRFITLLTDYHYKDFYLGKVKSRILRCFSEHRLLDICHGVDSFDLLQTSYAFNGMRSEFSSDDIHFIFVKLHYDKNFKILIAKTKNHGIIVVANNGILGLLNIELEKIYELPVNKGSFVELSLIEQISQIDFSILKECETPFFLKRPEPRITEKEIRGEIMLIDQYGNCISNIHQSVFEPFVQNSIYEICFRREKILSLSDDYSDNREAGAVAIFNEQGWLEIASVEGNGSKLFGLGSQSKISVKKN